MTLMNGPNPVLALTHIELLIKPVECNVIVGINFISSRSSSHFTAKKSVLRKLYYITARRLRTLYDLGKSKSFI